jgi:hypothetical protein
MMSPAGSWIIASDGFRFLGIFPLLSFNKQRLAHLVVGERLAFSSSFFLLPFFLLFGSFEILQFDEKRDSSPRGSLSLVHSLNAEELRANTLSLPACNDQ